ncbi:MAG TPA: serine hydrolase domain-containing protein [Polyangium sp.]|nr:serine hydrolase domain-containing protein [Polyangium sp.]
MRSFYLLSLSVLAACSSQPPPPPTNLPVEQPPAVATSIASIAAPVVDTPVATPPERVTADTPKTTSMGNTFIVPAEWSISVKGPVTILETPEVGSRVIVVDVLAKDADAAIEAAWEAYGIENRKWPLKSAVDVSDRNNWTRVRVYEYMTSPNEKRTVVASTRFANNTWNVVIYDMADAVGEKRGAQVGVFLGRLYPKGKQRETFAGKTARTLDAARIAELGKFVDMAREKLQVPGVALGIIQGGKVVFSGGFGVREVGKKAAVDGDTKFIIASNTKAMTTLMLGKLVDQQKITWESQAKSLLPTFKLGDAETTNRVLVKHLICACTGLPRQDLEWLFQFGKQTPDEAMKSLGTMQPTSKFGELFQYSNPLAAAAGFVGGHVAFPKLELGKAYDEAMRTLVFEPLEMKTTTFDFKRARTGNFASAHARDIDGKTVVSPEIFDEVVVSVRPAGGAWSTVNDVLKYVQMELAEGKLPNGKQYISKEALLARRAFQVAINADAIYGMGLMVDKTWGVTVVHHGGDIFGFHSDMLWLPEHGVGAVILTNGDPGWEIRSSFQRKLLEVLFDGEQMADKDVLARGKAFVDQIAVERKLLTVPADAAESAKLAPHYRNDALGEINVSHKGAVTMFDVGEWKSEVATRKNNDGTISFVTTSPGVAGAFEFLVGSGPKRTLTTRDGQHEYVFQEQ